MFKNINNTFTQATSATSSRLRKLREIIFKTKKGRKRFVLFILFIAYWFCLPSKLFNDPTSTVLLDSDGKLMGAMIATDGQWRFPDTYEVPDKFAKAIIQFEDKQFFSHPGVNPFSIGRAILQDIKEKKIVSGGSTIPMQVIRLSRKGNPRTFWEKFVEITQATRATISYSKKEILRMYASHAPFGSNVVGLEAAAWRYFGRSSQDLSWGETTVLAVLPNAPGLIYPGKNHVKLRVKRNRLLDKLFNAGEIDAETRDLAKAEPLPDKPHTLPSIAPHLLIRASQEGYNGRIIHSTLNGSLQQRVNQIVKKHHIILSGNQINNLAALVMDVNTGKVVCYIGNVDDKKSDNSPDVDIIMAPRSTGSILKPYLFASILSDGDILPYTLMPDIPTIISGYAPQNYNLTFDGAVPAKQALSRSLNIPAVKMLQLYGVGRFSYVLKKLGLTTITKTADHYGLSLILGGAEAKLWELAGIYASIGRTLSNYPTYGNRYNKFDYHMPYYAMDSVATHNKQELSKSSLLDVGSIKLTIDAMVEVNRPDEESAWRFFNSTSRIAWKTGTSFGFRDGWAIGLTPEYVVAVWAGNADGEGRPGLTGIATAAPVMFEIFNVLKPTKWFEKNNDEMIQIKVCSESGYKASTICDQTSLRWIQKAGMKTLPCPYHRMIHLDATGKYRVNSDCENVSNMKHSAWFVLPPAMELYYKAKHASYKDLPPMRSDCKLGPTGNSMEIIYPKNFSQIYVPVELDGKAGNAIFEVAHRRQGAIIYWHLDEQYIGSTSNFHQMAINSEAGIHTLTLVDNNGETIFQKFEVIGKKK